MPPGARGPKSSDPPRPKWCQRKTEHSLRSTIEQLLGKLAREAPAASLNRPTSWNWKMTGQSFSNSACRLLRFQASVFFNTCLPRRRRTTAFRETPNWRGGATNTRPHGLTAMSTCNPPLCVVLDRASLGRSARSHTSIRRHFGSRLFPIANPRQPPPRTHTHDVLLW